MTPFLQWRHWERHFWESIILYTYQKFLALFYLASFWHSDSVVVSVHNNKAWSSIRSRYYCMNNWNVLTLIWDVQRVCWVTIYSSVESYLFRYLSVAPHIFIYSITHHKKREMKETDMLNKFTRYWSFKFCSVHHVMPIFHEECEIC